MADTIETALPYFRFTREMLQCFVANNVSATTMQVYALLEMNKDMNRGITHKLLIKDLANALGAGESTIYRSIVNLKDIGMFKPTDWGYIIGALPYAQLANHTAKAATQEKQLRTFYEEMKERIIMACENVGRPYQAEPMLVRKVYTELVGERKSNKVFFPVVESRDLMTEYMRYTSPDSSSAIAS